MNTSARQFWVVIGALAALVGYGSISTDFYLAGLPAMMADFGVDHASIQLTLSVFMVGYGAGQLFYGPMSDHYGRKRILYIGLCLYVVASIICLVSTSLSTMLAGRLLQGLAAASGPVVARAIVRDLYAGKDAVKVMMYLTGVMALAPILAPVVGGWLLAVASWRSHFIVLGLFGVVTLLLTRFVVPDVTLVRYETRSVFSSILSSFKDCITHPVFMGYVLVGSLSFAGMFSFISSAPFVFIELMSVPETQFGYYFMAVICGYLIGSQVGARFVDRYGAEVMLFCGLMIALMSAVALLVYVLAVDVPTAVILLPFSGFFAGAGLVYPCTQILSLSVFDKAAGGASSVFGFVQVMCGALSGFLIGHAYNDSALPSAIFLVGCAGIAVGIYFLLVAKRTRA